MQSKVFFGGGWYVIMIASCGRGVEGVVPDDYNITQGELENIDLVQPLLTS